MSDTIKKEFNVQTLNLKSKIDEVEVCRKHLMLVPCELAINEDVYEFKFDIRRLKEGTLLVKESELNKLRFLINTSNLIDLTDEFLFKINLDNIYFDFNMNVKVLSRDLGKTTDFVAQYKALICTIINGKYSFDDYYKNGNSLVKDKFLVEILSLDSVEEIVEVLKRKYVIRKKYYTEKMKGIRKINYYLLILIVSCSVLFSTFLAVKWNDASAQYNDNKINLEASNNFNKGEYRKVIDNLKYYKTSELSKDNIYILAISYINTSALTPDQRNNALKDISKAGNSEYNKFWVYLGRKEFKKAYNVASNFDSDRLLYYGYSVEYASLKTNTKLTADEKAQRQKQLEQLLDEYVKKIKGEK